MFGSDGKAYPLANDQVKKLVNAKYVNYPVLKYIYIFSCLISLYSFVNGDRIIESVPTHFSKANGFESITEWLNVIRSGHLKIQATCDIPFQTEVLLDYNLIRYCFHPSGSCSSSKPPSPFSSTHKELNSNLFSCFIRTSL